MSQKTCKFCRSTVDELAYKCPHCGEWIRKKKKLGGIIAGASLVVVVMVIVSFMARNVERGREIKEIIQLWDVYDVPASDRILTPETTPESVRAGLE